MNYQFVWNLALFLVLLLSIHTAQATTMVQGEPTFAAPHPSSPTAHPERRGGRSLSSSSLQSVQPSLANVTVQYLVSTKTYNVTTPSFFTRTLGHNFDRAVTVLGKNSSISETDDTPLELLSLGFPFDYYGKRTTSVWANPNGGLQFQPAPPCGCCFSTYTATGVCDYNSSYYNMIALSVTDLAPIDNPDCSVRYSALGPTAFGLAFVNVPLFGVLPKPGPTWTFGVTLSNKGKIETAYQKIFNTAHPPGTPTPIVASHVAANWLIGVRAPKVYDQTLEVSSDAEQYFINQPSWQTSVRGAYPPKTEVRNGIKITYCPAPTSLCVQPASGKQGNGAGTETTLTLTGNSLFGCDMTELPLQCRFHLPSTAPFSGFVDTAATVVVVVDTIGDTIVESITCPTPTIVATSTSAAVLGVIDVEIVYLSTQGSYDDVPTPFSKTKWEPMPTSTQLQFEFVAASSAGTADACDSGSGGSGGDRVCDECGVCGGTDVCTTGTCDGHYNSALDCAGVCNGPGVIDENAVCCESPLFLDCNGMCNGTSIEAWVQFPTILSKGCCPKVQVDCTGLCRGGAAVDQCGLCAGGATGLVPNAQLVSLNPII